MGFIGLDNAAQGNLAVRLRHALAYLLADTPRAFARYLEFPLKLVRGNPVARYGEHEHGEEPLARGRPGALHRRSDRRMQMAGAMLAAVAALLRHATEFSVLAALRALKLRPSVPDFAKSMLHEIWGGRHPRACEERVRTLPRHLGGEIPQSRRLPGGGSGGVARLIRFPGGALAESADDEPHRVDLRHHPAANGEDEKLPEREYGAESGSPARPPLPQAAFRAAPDLVLTL